MKRILSMALGIAALGSAALAADTMLKVGDPAPPLKVAKWVKGQPTEKFATGEVYVVEFWATWCGPCRMTIPHLTEMNKQFAGKAHFMGVSIWERVADDTQRLEKVGKFVDTMGAKMEYAVAADATGDFMANNWMVPARQGGIPTAFVVDRNSKIAWIGHPMSDMAKVVSQVIAGTFDVKAEAERRAQAP